MKLNKKTTLPVTSFGLTMRDMEKAMNELTQVVSRLSKTELLEAVLQSWPFSVQMTNPNGEPLFVDSVSYEFQLSHLLEIWSRLPMSNFIERQHNECETKDVYALWDIFLGYPPETVMSVEMFLKVVREYFEQQYPIPEPEMFHSFSASTMEQKDYFLPALKVLNWSRENNTLWSPIYHVPWTDYELNASHVNRSGGNSGAGHLDMAEAMGRCDCGIYASVNMSELWQYVSLPDQQASALGMDYHYRKEDRRLCIIEPFSDATVWMARKGWKASKAFVSEIVGETINLNDAAELLSMVWRRRLDLNLLYGVEAPE